MVATGPDKEGHQSEDEGSDNEEGGKKGKAGEHRASVNRKKHSNTAV